MARSSTDSIQDGLLAFVASHVPGGAAVTASTDLLEQELLDSLLIMDLVAHVESTYGVRLENADLAPRNFRTVAALARLVEDRRRA